MINRGAVSLRVLPASRTECRRGPRPCPYVSCRYHLLLNVTSDGRLYSQRTFDEASEDSIAKALRGMARTCALDVADEGAHTFEEVSMVMGLDVKEVSRHSQRAQGKVAVMFADGGAEMTKREKREPAAPVPKPGAKCDCPTPKHVIAQTAWSAFSGYELRWACHACGATWTTRQRNPNGAGRVF